MFDSRKHNESIRRRKKELAKLLQMKPELIRRDRDKERKKIQKKKKKRTTTTKTKLWH